MARLVAFDPVHLERLDVQPAQAWFTPLLADRSYGEALAAAGPAFTLLADDGATIACGGCVERWENVAQAWMLVAADAGPHLLPMLRAVRGFLAQARWRRIEAAATFSQGRRMLRLLGFQAEGLARAYTPDGQDAWLFARIAT